METKQELLTLNGKEYLLDIEQAEQLGLLKEKDSRVKSWEEFQDKYSYPNLHRTSAQLYGEETTALAAFSKLLKLRRDWIGKWEHDWSIRDQSSGMIVVNHNRLTIGAAYTVSHPLTFPTQQMAKEFLETFHDLIEEAKILI